ncbi:hypothetical protein GGX14DRAFT_387770 [Mycena pura]|uniref:Uncharacterized protein n=1 Tax=Mycena pura TaxID=153505 RepID=A0AAD6YM42_9AGAR|nr:hypothetical protein GGX14DRAFT_387770 [Mycena pura]
MSTTVVPHIGMASDEIPLGFKHLAGNVACRHVLEHLNPDESHCASRGVPLPDREKIPAVSMRVTSEVKVGADAVFPKPLHPIESSWSTSSLRRSKADHIGDICREADDSDRDPNAWIEIMAPTQLLPRLHRRQRKYSRGAKSDGEKFKRQLDSNGRAKGCGRKLSETFKCTLRLPMSYKKVLHQKSTERHASTGDTRLWSDDVNALEVSRSATVGGKWEIRAV